MKLVEVYDGVSKELVERYCITDMEYGRLNKWIKKLIGFERLTDEELAERTFDEIQGL